MENSKEKREPEPKIIEKNVEYPPIYKLLQQINQDQFFNTIGGRSSVDTLWEIQIRRASMEHLKYDYSDKTFSYHPDSRGGKSKSSWIKNISVKITAVSSNGPLGCVYDEFDGNEENYSKLYKQYAHLISELDNIVKYRSFKRA